VRLLPLFLLGCTFAGDVGDTRLVDADGDGAFDDTDCDDDEPRSFPGNPETCDGVDNDCNGAADDRRVCAREEAFLQTSRLDVLFIIDDSSSMVGFQDSVADSIDDLLEVLAGDDSNTHIGAITTDMADPTARGRLRGTAGTRWLDPTSPPDAIASWTTQGIQVGEGGSGDERGLDAFIAAMTTHADGYNAGFRRPDAHLVVVTLSDERDVSDNDVADVLDLLPEVAPSWSFHAIVPLGDDCGDAWPTSRHVELAALSGGTVLSICEADYGPFLSAIGQFSQRDGLRRRFPLVDVVRPGTLEVEVTFPGAADPTPLSDDEVALSIDGREFRYTGDVPPPARSRFVVRYEALPTEEP
jgi:hypothetical protein